jgi:ATP-dependent RNA helicase RhlE
MVPRQMKTDLLLKLLDREAMHSVLVFVRTRRGADNLAKRLQQANMETACLHGDRTQRERERALTSFKRRDVRVLVATDVAARGLHVDGVTHVVNYDMPMIVSDYLNRIGRTARAGAEGDALTLATREDVPVLERIERALGRPIDRVTVQGMTESAPVATAAVAGATATGASGLRRGRRSLLGRRRR